MDEKFCEGGWAEGIVTDSDKPKSLNRYLGEMEGLT